MPVTSSEVALGHLQANGSRYVLETHTWDDGSMTRIEYGPIFADGLDVQSAADQRGARLSESAGDQEFQDIINGD